jgi:hypothetical protein
MRLANIKRNAEKLKMLGLSDSQTSRPRPGPDAAAAAAAKRRRLSKSKSQGLEGCTVRKKFVGTGVFDGVVIGDSDDSGRYTIEWSDGSTTTMKREVVLKHAVAQADGPRRRSSRIADLPKQEPLAALADDFDDRVPRGARKVWQPYEPTEDDPPWLLTHSHSSAEAQPQCRDDLDEGGEQEAFDYLDAWRIGEADEQGFRDPYMVVVNQTMCSLVRLRPASTPELFHCWGLSDVRVGKYGDALLALLAEHKGLLRTGRRTVLDSLSKVIAGQAALPVAKAAEATGAAGGTGGAGGASEDEEEEDDEDEEADGEKGKPKQGKGCKGKGKAKAKAKGANETVSKAAAAGKAGGARPGNSGFVSRYVKGQPARWKSGLDWGSLDDFGHWLLSGGGAKELALQVRARVCARVRVYVCMCVCACGGGFNN